ncbi:26461_t:CDS:2 [Gigaspora margarita]|uniref:26461_t:CDS:1 n=1 Tax=Gigaspora margarita TaxID=4874 RepID=A0ABM8W2B2_GIGMA|nr:26461_t:CDS:2 [Gigaspora margarita]
MEIKDIKLQLKELRVLVEVSVKELEDLVKKFPCSEEDLENNLESLYDLDNFYKFGERIIINGDVRCINGVRA